MFFSHASAARQPDSAADAPTQKGTAGQVKLSEHEGEDANKADTVGKKEMLSPGKPLPLDTPEAPHGQVIKLPDVGVGTAGVPPNFGSSVAPWGSLYPLLIVLVALLVFSVWLSRRSGRLILGRRSGQVLSVQQSIAVGPKERIALVQAGDKQLVVGVTSQVVQLLVVLDGRPAKGSVDRAPDNN